MTQVQLVIDGVTGVGKSSLTAILAQELDLIAFAEIFEDQHQLLHRFFHDRERWCFPMQLNFLSNRLQQFHEATGLNRAVMDRSIFSDPIFARMYREAGYLSVEEYDVYLNLYHNITAGLTPPALVVYLQADSGEIISRIHRRGRPDEIEVEPSYWHQLHHYYEEHYRQYQIGPLLVVNVTTMDYVNNPDHRRQLVSQIRTTWEQARNR